jgi:CRISPR-associated protein Cas2
MRVLILITYDVSTTDSAGRKRLRRVAKTCQNFGQRVQNSVFECVLDNTQFRHLEHELEKLIDLERDSLRFYNLGDKYQPKVHHVGIKEAYDIEGPLIL